LPATVGAVHKTEIVKVNIAAHVSVRHLLREHGEQSILLLDSFRQREVRGLGTVGHIGILFIGMKDELIHIVGPEK